MKNKSLRQPAMIIAIGLIVAIVAYLLTGILKTPTITEQDFNYSATYKLKGETKKLEGIYKVCFKSTGKGTNPLDRYYEGYYVSEPNAGQPEYHTIAKQEDLELRVVFIFTDDYLMGDGDRGEKYIDAIPEPYLAVYDEQGCEYTDLEMLEKFDAELISWETPQPIENKFVFSGFSMLHDESMFAMLLVGILVTIATIVFVKKDKTIPCKALDKCSILFNFLISIIAMPFITLVVAFMQIYVSGDEFIYQLDLCLPAFTMFTIAASIALRRRGFSKSGFFIQFIGPAVFALLAILEAVI